MSGRWVTGDHTGCRFPRDPAAFRDGDVAFLTKAFRARRLGRRRCGSTGAKKSPAAAPAARCVAGRRLRKARGPDLHTELFVKFSRDFDDPVRDRGRTQMESEVRLASLSLPPGFPHRGAAHAVRRLPPRNRHRNSDQPANPVRLQRNRAAVSQMPRLRDAQTSSSTTARCSPPSRGLAGAHRSGRLPARLIDEFPVDLRAAAVGEPPPLTPDKLQRRLAHACRVRRNASQVCCPPTSDRRSFWRGSPTEAPQVMEQEPAIWRYLAEAQRLHRAVALERQRRQRMVLDATSMAFCGAA